MNSTPNARLLLGLLTAVVGLWGGCAASRNTTPIVRFPPAPVYPPDHEFTLDELVDLSVHRNPSLDVSRYVADAALGLVDQVKALWLPAVRYDFAATAYSKQMVYNMRALHIVPVKVPLTGAYNITNNVALAEIVSTGGKRTSGLKQAKMFAALTRIDVLRQQDLVAFGVAASYQIVCLTTQIDAVLDDALRRIRVFRQVAAGLNERGSLRANDLDSLEAEFLVTQLEQLQIAVRAGRAQAYCALKKAVGLNPAEPLLLRSATLPPLVTPAERLSVAAAIVQGFLHRPETQEVNLFARIQAEQVKFAKAAWAPNIVVLGNEITIAGNGNPILNAIDGIIAGVIIDVPIYDPARRARLREALGLEQAGLALQREVEQLVTLEIDVSALEAQKALALVMRAARAVQIAAEHYDASRQAYSRELIPAAGVVTAVVLDAGAKIEQLTVLFNYHVARANLKRAMADRETAYGY
jgi:outer membrane protein TolC